MSNRRDFLKNISLLATGSWFLSNLNSTASAAPQGISGKKKIGLQIYSLQGELYKNLPESMQKLQKMGYSHLELAGYNDGKIGGVEMMEFKKITEDAGLKITSSHVNPPVGEYTAGNLNEIKEFWKKTADNHAKLGVNYLIQPGQPKTRNTEEVKYVCNVFNEAGRIIKASGLPFGYHNHDREFGKVVPGGTGLNLDRSAKGDTIYDLFMRHTDPDLVLFELDVYWCVMGHQDPVEYMKKYPDRIKVLHIKDRHVLGQSGMMNFESIFKQAYANGIGNFYVELEGMPKGSSQFEGVEASCAYLEKSKFVK